MWWIMDNARVENVMPKNLQAQSGCSEGWQAERQQQGQQQQLAATEEKEDEPAGAAAGAAAAEGTCSQTEGG